jgi:hypothetical protein
MTRWLFRNSKFPNVELLDSLFISQVFETFASFGLIFEIQIKSSEMPTTYAFIKYYLAVDAAAAQCAQISVRGKQLKIDFARRRSSMHQTVHRFFPLHRCIELSNYLWGSSGWCSRVVELNSIFSADSVKVICRVELSVSGLTVHGAACICDIVSLPGRTTSTHNLASSIGTIKKRAISEATVDAFQSVAVLVLPDRSIQTLSILPNSETPVKPYPVLF